METATLRSRMLHGLPVESRTLDVGGVATSVLEVGTGAPLVLLHGGIECGGIYWAPVLAELARAHRLIVPDVPGLGESAPVERLDVDTFAAWFECLLDLTGLERPALVAHSLLGSMAARYAAHGSDRLDRLVIYGAPGVGPYRMPWQLRYLAIRFMLRPTAHNAERFDRFALLDLDANRQRNPEWFAAFETYTQSRAREKHVKRTMGRLIGAMIKPIDDEQLDRISIPTALLWGRHDRMVPLAVAEHAAQRHGWPLHVVEDAAHAPHVEQPGRFLDALDAALATS